MSVIIIVSVSKIYDSDDNTVGDNDNNHSDFDEIIIINTVVVKMIV